MLDSGDLAIGVDLVQVPLRLHSQMNVDLLSQHVLSISNQTNPLSPITTAKEGGRGRERKIWVEVLKCYLDRLS